MTNPSSDPLQAYSGLALFPRTLISLSISLPSRYQSDDLMQTHNILASMPFEVDKELEEEAKAILAESLKQGIQTLQLQLQLVVVSGKMASEEVQGSRIKSSRS